jgi:hypothetical protein
LSNIRVIKYSECWEYIVNDYNVSKNKLSGIIVEDYSEYNCLTRCLYKMTRKLDNQLCQERLYIFALANEKLSFENTFYSKMITSVYKLLTNQQDCQCYGKHWANIGFQGNNPKTDLRGVGMFGILQLLAFCERYTFYARDILEYSCTKEYGFPMASLMLNFSMFTLEALREGHLINACNKGKSVVNTVNEFYFCLVEYFFNFYSKQKCTIHYLDDLLKEIHTTCKKHPKKILSLLERLEHKYKK